ncbi:MAG TPA: hypothetical protein VLT36_15500 [Candidatus Dormibacteraeota bacterium]|nr:hypothetical protein [Candidatus Dormibacteraeota bacterium]
MKNMKQLLVMGAMAGALCLGANQSLAQNNTGGDRQGRGGNFDPAQWRQNRLDDYRDRLEIKDDAEWKAIQPMVEKVMDAGQAVIRDRMSGMFGRRRSDSNSSSTDNGGDNNRRRSRGGFPGGEPSPESEALQRAIDGKASKSELKAALDKFQAARKQKQADLEAAQDKLRAVLTPRQEAIATVAGLL